MTLGILAAMEQEISLVCEMIENPVRTELGGRTFYRGMLKGIDCVVCFSKWGKVAAAITSTLMIEHFHITDLIFIGTAGALSNKLNVGDIVVAKRLVQHDLDASPIIQRFQIPLTDHIYIESDPKLSSLAIKSINKLNFIQPCLVQGDVASGDQFISSDEKRQELISLLPEVLCVEMEGAAVAQVCKEFQLPFTVIRIISDRADHDARVDFNHFTEAVANIYSQAIIREMTEELSIDN